MSQFVGRSGTCPRCGQKMTVPAPMLEEQPPVLVMDDGHRRPRRPWERSD
jgi:hypothetical protein